MKGTYGGLRLGSDSFSLGHDVVKTIEGFSFMIQLLSSKITDLKTIIEKMNEIIVAINPKEETTTPDDPDEGILTYQLIEKLSTDKAEKAGVVAITRSTALELGLKYPLVSGWLRELIGKKINKLKYEQIYLNRNKKGKQTT